MMRCGAAVMELRFVSFQDCEENEKREGNKSETKIKERSPDKGMVASPQKEDMIPSMDNINSLNTVNLSPSANKIDTLPSKPDLTPSKVKSRECQECHKKYKTSGAGLHFFSEHVKVCGKNTEAGKHDPGNMIPLRLTSDFV